MQLCIYLNLSAKCRSMKSELYAHYTHKALQMESNANGRARNLFFQQAMLTQPHSNTLQMLELYEI